MSVNITSDRYNERFVNRYNERNDLPLAPTYLLSFVCLHSILWLNPMIYQVIRLPSCSLYRRPSVPCSNYVVFFLVSVHDSCTVTVYSDLFGTFSSSDRVLAPVYPPFRTTHVQIIALTCPTWDLFGTYSAFETRHTLSFF